MYDSIVLREGLAGCILANRLPANPSISILLIESGVGEASAGEIQVRPDRWDFDLWKALGSDGWNFAQMVPFAAPERVLRGPLRELTESLLDAASKCGNRRMETAADGRRRVPDSSPSRPAVADYVLAVAPDTAAFSVKPEWARAKFHSEGRLSSILALASELHAIHFQSLTARGFSRQHAFGFADALRTTEKPAPATMLR